MKTFLTLFVLLFSSSVVGEWIEIARTDNVVYYVDKESIFKKNDNTIYVWQLENYFKPLEGGTLSYLVYKEILCDIEGTIAQTVEGFSNHWGKGDSIIKYSAVEMYPDPMFHNKNTAGYLVMKYSCGI
tara:strand:- start:4233 stop:4616 length:384 start_codon:yes stop_codon:yes gene_type:complete